MTDRHRLDQFLVKVKNVASRSRAAALIKEGAILVNGQRAHKASLMVDETDKIDVSIGEDFVSRGAQKLVAALKFFALPVEGLCCLDLGASTGGFTDVLLRAGAAKIYAVDVGSGQLHPRIAVDPRVVNFEKTHANKLDRRMVTELIDLIVCDVSFISSRKILDYGLELASPAAHVISLLKPQFELGPEKIGKGGIVNATDDEIQGLISDMKDWFEEREWRVKGVIESPIKGGDGNTEYLIAASR